MVEAPSKPVAEAPKGTDQAPARIRAMFNQISPTYDGLNHLFSGMLDPYWRWRMARELTRGLDPCRRILDVATGTGDLARAVRRRSGAEIVGADFAESMLRRAARKLGREGYAWVHADGLRLPFADGAFDAACIAFGLRNMADRAAGLSEMRRVVRAGGRVGVLEFSRPRGAVLRAFYDLYSFTIMPRMGRWISGSTAYLYLPESIRNFMPPDELAAAMRAAGMANVRHFGMAGGIVRIHLGEAA